MNRPLDRRLHEASDDAAPNLVTQPLQGAITVPITLVDRDENQPRRDWRHDAGYQRLDELAASIREFGIVQPLAVRRNGERYTVIAGGRRLVAAKRAGLTEIPVVVRDDAGATIRVLQLIENVQRHNLSPLDEARAYQELMDLEGLSASGVAQRVHVTPQQVRDRLRLLRDQVLADAVERRQIAASVAREISKLPDELTDDLRRRVLQGERLQSADVAAVRMSMAQAGVINPKRAIPLPPGTRATTAIPEPSLTNQSQQGSHTQGGPAVVHISNRTAPTLQARHVGAGYATDEPGTEEGSSRLNRADPVPVAGNPLEAFLARLDRDAFEGALLYGVDRGWSCAGLLHHARLLWPDCTAPHVPDQC